MVVGGAGAYRQYQVSDDTAAAMGDAALGDKAIGEAEGAVTGGIGDVSFRPV